MKLTYIFHSGFAIEAEHFSILIDYFQDTENKKGKGYVHEQLLKRPVPLYILSSHFHADHFNPEILTWKELKPDIHYIFSKDILKRKRAVKEDATYLKKGDEYTDGIVCVKAFGSTDVGVSFYIQAGGKTIFHAGDLNNWHWKDESTPEEIKHAEDHYQQELDLITEEIRQLDLAMFPVDARIGTDYDKGARQFLNAVKVSLFAPMHFEPAYKEAQAFEAYAVSKQVCFFNIIHKGQQIEF